MLSATKGQRTLLCEVNTQRPVMGSIFDHPSTFEPEQILPNLDLCNVDWDGALSAYLQQFIPLKMVVSRILGNQVIRRFLNFAPGARELFLLSRLVQLVESYDMVVVDMHASGHAFSMLDVTRSALTLFRSGPMLRRAEQMAATVRDPKTRMVFVALPEEMVVNETIETRDRMAASDLLGGEPIVILNRATLPSLSEDERTLLQRLADQKLSPEGREFVRAGFWEDRLEQATAEAQTRLSEAFSGDPILVPPSPAGGLPRELVRDIAVHLGRKVGVTRRELPWT